MTSEDPDNYRDVLLPGRRLQSYLSLCRVRGLCPNSFNLTAFIFIIRQPPELRLKVIVPPRLEVTGAFDNMALAYLGLNKKRVVVVKNFSFFFLLFFQG